MEGKKKNIFIGILGATTVVAAGVAVYFGLKYSSSKTEIVRLQEKVNESKQTEIVGNNNAVIEYATPTISVENCINTGAVPVIRYAKPLSVNYEIFGTELSVSQNNLKTLNMTIYKDKLEKNNGLNLTLENANEHGYFSHDFNFDSNIKQVCMGGVGQASGADCIIFCLLEDGSVHCLNLYNAIKNNDFNNFTKLDELEDIIEVGKLEKVTTERYFSVYAARKDGKFYDLEDILKNKGLTL